MSPAQPPTQPNLIKRLTINVLRSLIRLLEGTVEKLEEPTPAPPFPIRQRRSLLSRLLFPIRRVLPISINRQLSDVTLAGLIAGFAILLFSVKSFLLPTNPPPQIAELPPSLEPTPSPVVIPEPEPEPLEPAADVEPTEPEQPEEPQIAEEPQVPEEPQPETIPDALTAEPPEPVEFVPASLPPEQSLIASIQDKMTDLTTQFGSEFVESVRANFVGGLLRVNLSNQWYELVEEEQNQIARQLFQQAQDLDFIHLELFNSQNHLIARSALVGSEMIILERSLDAESESIN